MTNILKLYKFVNDVNDTPFPNANEQAILYEFRHDAKRMGNIPTISGTILHPLCLDNLWGNDMVYVVYNSERYFLKQTPTSSYSNEDTRYKHEVEFVSERIVLNDVYFYDVVASDTTNDKPVSNSSNFTFYGDIHEFAQRLNYSLQYAKVGYSVVVDSDITSDAKMVSFQDQFFANVLQEVYNTYEIPYYFVGKVIHIGYTNNTIEHTFKYGIDDALLSIQKTNANYKVVNRATGIGSADNIPYYYPNKDEKGVSKPLYNGSEGVTTISNEMRYKRVKLSDVFTYSNQIAHTKALSDGSEYSYDGELTETSANIWELYQVIYPFSIELSRDTHFDIRYLGDDLEFINIQVYRNNELLTRVNKVGSFSREYGQGDYELRINVGIYHEGENLEKAYAQTIIDDISVSIAQEVEAQSGWYLNKEYNVVELSDYGLSISSTPNDGDKITFERVSYIIPQTYLMPPIYRESEGEERFYNALNEVYVNPETGDYYAFENPYQEGKPKEHIVSFEDIKPSIVGMTNASGARIDMFSEFAYDENDNDEFDEEGNYLHPYFFGKLRKFDGEFGFNLFDHTIEEDEMVISMTSGSCGACNFIIGVSEETQENLVQVDDNGNLKRDSEGNVLYGTPQERQNDTQNNEVWIALKKDINTFGVIMPNASNNYKPKAGDTFVILHIDLPQSYIDAAENRLKEEIIKYMAMNNSEKFTFSISFSRIFFAQNPTILAQLDENARLQIEYNGRTYDLYVSSYSYNVTSDSALPEIRVELSDTLTIAQNALQNAISEVKVDIMNNINKIDWQRLGVNFLRKDMDDRSKGKVASDVGFEVGKFVSGTSGAIVYIDANTGQTIAELDKLYVRMKAYFEQLEIVNVNSVGGKQIISPAGSIHCSNVEDKVGYYRCYFLSEQDGEKVQNRFVVGDLAYCQLYNAQSGVTNNISNKYYWRLVVGVGEDYIDLSKTDCDSGSDAPEIGDVICHRGNRNDADRQNLIEFSSVDTYSPSIILYQGINTYSLSGKDIVSFGVDKATNKAFMNVYGDMYIGDRNNASYMRYTQENGLELKGKLAVGTTLSDGRDLEQAINEATPEGYEEFVESVTNLLGNLQNQVDGAIDSYFLEYDATLSNYPANEWDTDEEKQAHLGDTFTNNITGDSWRWGLDTSGNYAWIYISDTATKKALETASKAQDTADGKRRVFIETPFPPYDLGDLWAGGEDVSLKRCINAKESGSFSADDWGLADDSHAYSDAVKAALEKQITDTKNELDSAISNAEEVAKGYTDEAKSALQGVISELDSAKANINDVYTKAQADEEISRAEQDAIDAAEEAANAAIALSEEVVKAYADGIVDEEEQARIKQAQENLDAAKKYADDKVQEAFDEIAGYEYLKRALGESTSIEGGLVQTSLLMLGYTENGTFNVMSGTNGLYDGSAKGGGIAAWYGGPMADKEADSSLVEFAQSVFRFDGSGYLAGGNITWDKDGAGSVAGGDLSWDKNGVITLGQTIKISGDANETLSSVLKALNEFRGMFEWDGDGNIQAKAGLWTNSFLTAGGIGETDSGSGGLIQNVYGYGDLGGTFSNNNLTDTFNAYTINQLYTSGESIKSRIEVLESNMGVINPDTLLSLNNYIAGNSARITSLESWIENPTAETAYFNELGIRDKLNVSGPATFDERITGIITEAINLTGTPTIKISSNTIGILIGEKTSSYITIPYATKALNDNSGREIVSTYSTKLELETAIKVLSEGVSNVGNAVLSLEEQLNNATFETIIAREIGIEDKLNVAGNVTIDSNLNVLTGSITTLALVANKAALGATTVTTLNGYTPITSGNISSQFVMYAATAGKLTDSALSGLSVGHSTQPVYFSAGVPVTCTKYADASVNYATTAALAIADKQGNDITTTYTKKTETRTTSYAIGKLSSLISLMEDWMSSPSADVAYFNELGIRDKLNVTGLSTFDANVSVNANIVATGAITAGSDARYKSKLQDVAVDIETIANAPLFNFRWSDGREDNRTYLGTTAQYWNNTPFKNAVISTNDKSLWTISYSQIAMGNTIVLARELLPIKRKVSEIDSLKDRLHKAERRIEILEQELNQYRRA